MIRCRLSSILGEKRMKVADIVRATKISKTTLHKLYNEQSTRVDFDTIDALCEVLEVEVGELFVHEKSNDTTTTQ